MAEGRSNQAIGERLFITGRAVEKHVGSIFRKLAELAPATQITGAASPCSRCSERLGVLGETRRAALGNTRAPVVVAPPEDA